MRVSIPILLTTGVFLVVGALGCNGPTGPDKPPEINEDIVKIFDALSRGRSRRYVMASWPRREMIYATLPLSRLQVDESLELVGDSVFVWEGLHLYVEANREGTRLLYVLSEYGDASAGSLYEMDLKTGEKRLLRDSTYAVSSAVYLPGSGGEKVVYYSYGSLPELENDGPTAGYYLLDPETGQDSLLFEHRSPAGLKEIFNGFDVSPNGQTLLYPINYDHLRAPDVPQAVAYELDGATPDTLDWTFGQQFLWLRYSPNGTRVLYNIYQEAAFHSSSGRLDSIGVIDLQTGARRALDTGTRSEEAQSLDLFPRWGPSGRHIVYGSAPVAGRSGAVGTFSLYVLKNVN